jgi:hypothetical protein
MTKKYKLLKDWPSCTNKQIYTLPSGTIINPEKSWDEEFGYRYAIPNSNVSTYWSKEYVENNTEWFQPIEDEYTLDKVSIRKSVYTNYHDILVDQYFLTKISDDDIEDWKSKGILKLK